MASLFDLVQQYLKRDNLPKPFTYDRTPPIGTNPPGLFPQPPVKPIEKILPVQGGGGDGFSVYNPDPNRTRDKSNYSPYAYRQAAERNLIGDFYSSGTEAQKLMDNYPDYYEGKQLTGIPGAAANYLKNSFVGKGLEYLKDKMPVNKRAIYENELLGQGIMVNDIGQIVSDGGDINKADGSNIMAGYNANKVTAQTFQKRRDMINAKMKDPAQKAAKLAALDAAEEKMLGTAKTRADMVFDDKSLAKDPNFISEKEITKNNNIINLEKEEDEDGEVSYYDPVKNQINSMPSFTGFNAPSTFTLTAPQYGDSFGQGYGSGYGGSTYDEEIFDPGDGTGSVGSVDPAGINSIDSTVYANENNPNSVSTSGLTYNQGGGQGGSYDEAGVNTGLSYNQGGGSSGSYDEAGINTGPTVGNATAKNTYTDAILRGNTGGGNDSSSNSRDKIVCTMMNESYGFGSFRNKIWLKHSKGLVPEYQKGYHKIFLPLIKIAKTNKVVRKILEHIAVHRTIDIRQESRGKVHLLGRVYRKILEPICYIVGKHG